MQKEQRSNRKNGNKVGQREDERKRKKSIDTWDLRRKGEREKGVRCRCRKNEEEKRIGVKSDKEGVKEDRKCK